HIRVTASGTITLDPTSGRTCGPEGISDLPDPKKLMPDQPTGALIAVISSDNDDFIFLGRSGEFTAARDGLLFLSVNEGVLADNTGSFKAVVEGLGPARTQSSLSVSNQQHHYCLRRFVSGDKTLPTPIHNNWYL